MPYIPPRRREELRRENPATPGELNYELTRVIQTYLDRVGRDYRAFNDVMGALECCKLELYRRVIGKYEDVKCELNGDVYDGA